MGDKREHSASTLTLVIGPRPVLGPLMLPKDVSAFRAEVIGGPMDGKKIRIESDWFSIGRNERNDLSLPLDPMVSSNHARVTREGQLCWLEDLGSRNGTYISGVRVERPASIEPGTLFVVGNTYIEFMPR